MIPGFARASVRELREEDDWFLVRKVQEGVERLDDEYGRSGIYRLVGGEQRSALHGK